MADNNETLGNFKIKVEVEGQQQVKTDLDALRASFKKLQDELKKAHGDGKKLADVLKSLKSVQVNVSGGGAGKSSVFSQIAKDAKDAAKQLSKFETALVAAKTKAATLSRTTGRVDRAFDRLVGEVKRDASGAIVDRTGLTGATYGINQFGRAMNRNGVRLYDTFAHLVGESTRDPVTGKWTRTGSKAMIHSFDALSKAALAAAKNLRKVGAKGGVGGPGGPGGPEAQSQLEKLISQILKGNNSLSAISKLLKGLNLGGLAGLSSAAGVLGIGGTLLNLLKGPFGWGLAAVGAGSYAVSKSQEWSSMGRNLRLNNWHHGRRMDVAGLDYDEIDRYARDNIAAHRVLDENGNIDWAKSYSASKDDAIGSFGNFDTDIALFETRGVEAPWMAALANQGIDYMTIRSHADLRNKAAEMKAMYDNGKLSKSQWMTFRSEMGSSLSNADWEMISRGTGYLNQLQGAVSGIKNTGGNANAINEATSGVVEELGSKSTIGAAEVAVKENIFKLAYSLTDGAKAVDWATIGLKNTFADLKISVGVLSDSFLKTYAKLDPEGATQIYEMRKKQVEPVKDVIYSGGDPRGMWQRERMRKTIPKVNKATEALDTHEATKGQTSMASPVTFQNTFQITSSDPVGVRNEIAAWQREQYRQANEVMRQRMLT